MPRPNQTRSVQSEANLARRIAYERAHRGYSLEGLAEEMTKAGCSIQGSAIYKIESADPPRRITVDELVALSKVFGMPIDELLIPADEAVDVRLRDAMTDVADAQRDAISAIEALFKAWAKLSRLATWKKAPKDVLTSIAQELAPDLKNAYPKGSPRLRNAINSTLLAVKLAATSDAIDPPMTEETK